MAFVRPTLPEIVDRIEGDIKGALNITSILRRSFEAVFARALAGAAHIIHGHLVFISRQIFPDQAEAELLDRWGSIYGLERNAATFAVLNIDITFTAAGTVPIDTVYQRVDGVEYELVAEVTAAGAGTETGQIRAITEGSDGNFADGNVVSLQSPIANVNSDATVTSTETEGEDRESDEEYRIRIVDRIQQPPAGGTANDYIQFAKTVTGVTRAWVFPGHLGEGTVSISFVEDNEDPIIPSAAKVAEVQAAVDLRKPVTANAVVFAPIETQVDLDISIKPNTAAIRAAAETELADLFLREAQVRGAFLGVGSTSDGKVPLSKINEAISLVSGEEDHVVNSPTTDPQPPTVGGILTLGTITWQTLA